MLGGVLEKTMLALEDGVRAIDFLIAPLWPVALSCP